MFASLEFRLILIAAVIATSLLGFYSWLNEHDKARDAVRDAQTAAATAKSAAEAAATESTWRENAHVLSLARSQADAATDSRYQRDLSRLRQRAASSPDVPQVPASSASGGSVGGLPERDSELVGIGYRSNLIRNYARECAAWIKALTP